MEALTGLAPKIFTRNNIKAPSSSILTLLGRSNIGFPRIPTPNKKLQFDHLVSFPSIARSHMASHVAEVSLELEDGDLDFQKLRKLTPFVSPLIVEFFLVGDDPVLGMWNPTNAVPMNWSDGHIWNVELDVPIESTVQFKFILKRNTGETFWQPGPDRIFKSWESKGTVVIAEDWENPEAQKITEEQTIDQIEKFKANVNNGAIVSGNSTYAEEKLNIFSKETTMFPVEGYQIINTNKKLEPEESAGVDIKEDPKRKNNSTSLSGKNSNILVEDEETLGRLLVPGSTSASGVY